MISLDDDNVMSYSQAIAEATDQAMALDEKVILIGQGTRDKGQIFGSVKGLYDKYGPERVFEMPLSENAVAGICLGASLLGLRPILVLQRADFLLLALDPIVNHAAKWNFMFAGHLKAPITVRCIVGKGWGQGPQHSQSLHGPFSHFPGLRIAMPSTPYDAKGILLNAVFSDDPVLIFEGRSLYEQKGAVEHEPYTVPFGSARICREGKDITIVVMSYLVPEALKAAESAHAEGISAEVIDPVSVTPLDEESICTSVAKTGRLIVVDTSWQPGGFGTDISAMVNEKLFGRLHAPVLRLSLPFYSTPTAASLENNYYPKAEDILVSCRRLMQ